MTVLGWSATIEPHWMYQIWAEQNIPDLNSVAYTNRRIEELFEQAGDRESARRSTTTSSRSCH
jgi:hypothetical protein